MKYNHKEAKYLNLSGYKNYISESFDITLHAENNDSSNGKVKTVANKMNAIKRRCK